MNANTNVGLNRGISSRAQKQTEDENVKRKHLPSCRKCEHSTRTGAFISLCMMYYYLRAYIIGIYYVNIENTLNMRTAATIPILTFLVYTVVLGQDEFNTQHVATSGVSRRFGFHHMGSSFATPADTSVEVANQPHPIITSKPYAYDFRISSSI